VDLGKVFQKVNFTSTFKFSYSITYITLNVVYSIPKLEISVIVSRLRVGPHL